jgi:hypothetical protein
MTCVSVAGRPPVAIGFASSSYYCMKAVTMPYIDELAAVVAAVGQTWKNG